MFYEQFAAQLPSRFSGFKQKLLLALLLAFTLCGAAATTLAQGLERDLSATEKATISIRNRNGRVVVTASDEQKGVSLKAESAGEAVAESDVGSRIKGNLGELDVRARRERDRV